MVTRSEIKYAKSGQLNIAYQVVGVSGAPVVLIPGWVSNVEEGWNLPGLPEFITLIAQHQRVVLFDKRGTGLSDRVDEENLPDLETRIDDLNAIMRHECYDRISIIGVSEGGPMAILFAARYPDMVTSLVLIGSYACWIKSKSNPFGIPIEKHERALAKIDTLWGKGFGLKQFAPSWIGKPGHESVWAAFLRKSASPNTAKALYRMNLRIDVQPVLDELNVPTLVIHRKNDRLIPFELGRQLAESIPGATLHALEGEDHLFWIDDRNEVSNRILSFLGTPAGIRSPESTFGTLALLSFEQDVLPDDLLSMADAAPLAVNHAGAGTVSVAFRGPNQALDFADQVMQRTEQLRFVLVHSGVIYLQEKTFSGPASDVVENARNGIFKRGIWMSGSSFEFVGKLRFASSLQVLTADPVSGIAVTWHLVEAQPANSRLKKFASFADPRLSLQDIATLLKVRDFLDSNFRRNPGLKELTVLFGVNNFKLKYGFRKLFGSPVKQYIINLRLSYAHQLLLESGLPVHQVARLAGYQHAASFTAAYRSRYGRSPVEAKRL